MTQSRPMIAWCNGELIESTAPAVSLLDHGLTVGDGVFETLKTVPGGVFALSRHLDRLATSARGLGLVPPQPDDVRCAVHEALAANAAADLSHGRVRITYTSGPGPAGSDRGGGPATLAVTVSEGQPWPATTSVAVAPWPRNERSPLTGLKTTSYAENAIALAWAKERGHSEALLGNLAGQLCEGTGSNVFVVVHGQVFTPSLSSGCLDGITRQLVMLWGDVPHGDLEIDAMGDIGEMFLTSSTRDVHPVTRLGDRDLPVGPVTRALADTFAARSTADIDP